MQPGRVRAADGCAARVGLSHDRLRAMARRSKRAHDRESPRKAPHRHVRRRLHVLRHARLAGATAPAAWTRPCSSSRGRSAAVNAWESDEISFPLLDAQRILALQNEGVRFGSHSVEHRPLVHIPVDDAREELTPLAHSARRAARTRRRRLRVPVQQSERRRARSGSRSGLSLRGSRQRTNELSHNRRVRAAPNQGGTHNHRRKPRANARSRETAVVFVTWHRLGSDRGRVTNGGAKNAKGRLHPRWVVWQSRLCPLSFRFVPDSQIVKIVPAARLCPKAERRATRPPAPPQPPALS